MPSHLSSIGFKVENGTELGRLAERVAKIAEPIAVKGGKYLRWAGGSGEELWLQVSAKGDLVGLSPHFSGRSRLEIGVVERLSRSHDSAFDGAFKAWASPTGESPEDGDYPFVFDAPDAALYADIKIPGLAAVQVTAFAHELAYFETEEAFSASQDEEEIKFASRSFLPAGLFGEEEDETPAHAMFTGQVVESNALVNPMTQGPYYWALVDTLGGRYDVVIDPSLLAGAPAAGGFLSGTFWLSGRLLDYARREKSWFGQLLGGSS